MQTTRCLSGRSAAVAGVGSGGDPSVIAGVVVEVPPLRSRLGDLAPIADAILARIAVERSEPVKKLSARTLTALKSHAWFGNIQKLENTLRTTSLFADSDVPAEQNYACPACGAATPQELIERSQAPKDRSAD